MLRIKLKGKLVEACKNFWRIILVNLEAETLFVSIVERPFQIGFMETVI